jgi:hypothetical protein
MADPAEQSKHNTENHDAWVLKSLEYDQLVSAKRKAYPRRRLSGLESVVIWTLRLYLIFMVAVVVYQILHGSAS